MTYLNECSKCDSREKEIFDKLRILLPKIKELDERRWIKGEELSRGDLPYIVDVLFKNSLNLSPSERLLSAWCCSILDRGVSYEKVWRDGLKQCIDWIKGDKKEFPQVLYSESRYFEATKKTLNRYKRIGAWFVETGKGISELKEGNLYRMIGMFASEWLGLNTKKVSSLINGSVGLLGDWKRLWMFFMMIRRDKVYWRPLFKEAIEKEPGGHNFSIQWDSNWYPEIECELPVDSRIKDFFNELGFSGNSLAIAKIAHKFGQQEKVSPSILDVAFVPGFNQELWEYGCKNNLEWSKWWKKR